MVVYTKNIYLWLKERAMKVLSLKLDENIFRDTEEITSALKKARNRYINEALSIYNLYNKKKLYKTKLSKESLAVSGESLKVLHEFEKLADKHGTI